ncbi:MAG: hypothetical protein PHY34_02375 [Patescibacteria group bacterium]|nr:hypothetical protein [Patescibacteria group bacterium]MDD5715218.1 hypothetical protein [Patescibacteria group bacterium]
MKRNALITTIVRLAFSAWIVFEFLNWIEVLHFSLDFTWSGLIVTSGSVWLAVEVISNRVRKATGEPFPWFVFLGAFLSVSVDAMGDVAHWYSKYMWYDQMAHAFGGGMTALLAFYLFWHLRQAGKLGIGKKLTGFIAVIMTMALGTCYEMEEYIEDKIRGVVGKRLGDGIDTADDMMWNMIGAIVVVLILMFAVRRIEQWRIVKASGENPEQVR